MSNTGTSSITATGFGRQTPQNPILRPPTYEDYLLAAIHDVSTGSFTYRDSDEFAETGQQLLRLVSSDYADGLNSPSGNTRPSARLISNTIFDQPEGSIVENPKGATDMFWLWGQYVDHDIDITSNSTDAFNIPVPTGDVHFDPTSTGTVVIPMNRSNFDPSTGSGVTPREHMNFITSELDASNVYGSTTERAHWLRTFKDGKLKISMGNMLPVNDGTMDNEGTAGKNPFVAGDVRANETPALLSIHTLFVREHNWWAEKIKADQPNLSDEEIYQRARVMVEGEIQAITFREFLPLLLGENAIPEYTGYDSEVNTRISNEFSTAAFRLGHSLVSDTILRLRNNDTSIGNLTLKDMFFAPHHYSNEGDIDYILRGFCRKKCQELDSKVVNSLRNFLFGEPGQGGLDLVSLNIQRGRDHGFPDYNTVRVGLGLGAKASFSEITSDSDVANALSTAYGGDISKIDLWVGGLCEDPVSGSQLGELFHHIVRDQFIRIRDGDELWYQNRMTPEMIRLVHRTKLSQIIKRHTNVFGIQNEVMKL